MMPAQKQVILQHLQSTDENTGKLRSISQIEAVGLYRIMRLASRVDELRKDGHRIGTTMRTDITGKRYARYALAE